ncbi:thioredoxin domain-containing protein [Pararhodospirillum oryzae]|uniref:Thioredoxin domain-containing protein n=1 Tax=Pararhodospirillum oryzae TaxID=478448 RepID=A0A512H3L1_9PROT|nr:thioredoxin domain-containing protein [Pararhodospirillum oryzae]GEO80044.1 thioredoxin domain-containing protein [Pararhodospirillum oryzae]
MSENRLGEASSPYLRQHRDNPVDWFPWGAEAFAEAQASGRPILLSVGYAACHWCHVMAHESFEDASVAAVINTHFVPVKVDREERPDVDAFYQNALALIGQPGGWPLTMFLTPDGRPFAGGTYFPRAPRFGRPGFVEVLGLVAEFARDHPARMNDQAGQVVAALARLETAPDAGPDTPPLPDLVPLARVVAGRVDPVHGGLTGAPKFPLPVVFQFLWRVGVHQDQKDARAAVTLTVTRMAQGGLYDHLAGGFARYATDETWLVPHFEKMLYDNAQLVDLLTLVWRRTRDPLLERRVRETVAWMDREMTGENGAFAASLDADNEGGEGAFAVWSEGEIDALLGPMAPAFKAAYGVVPGGNWEGHSILHRAGPILAPAEESALVAGLAPALDLLRGARDHRPRPTRDDKILADWNGLALVALVHAGQVFAEPAWIERARHAWDGIQATMTRPDQRLGHSLCRNQLQETALLEDYAAQALAAIALYEATGTPAFLDQAQAWMETVERLYRDPTGPGYYHTAADAADLPLRLRGLPDGVVPSGSGLLAWVFARLAVLTGAPCWDDRLEGLRRAAGAEPLTRFPHHAALLAACQWRALAAEVTLHGDDGSLAATLAALPHDAYAVRHAPARGPQPQATVCRAGVCGPLLSTPDALRDALALPRVS